MKRYRALLAIAILLSLSLVACGNDGGDAGATELSAFEDHLDRYVYLSTQIALEAEWVDGILIHDERIFYYHRTGQDLVITSLLPDGSDRRETRIPGVSHGLAGATITPVGHIGLLVVHAGEMFYAEYDLDGRAVSRQDFSAYLPEQTNWIQVEHLLFARNGYIVFFSWDNWGPVLYLLDRAQGTATVLEVDDNPWGLVELRDGRVATFLRQGRGDALRVIDLETGTWGEIIELTGSPAGAVFAAPYGSPFDLFLSGGRLYGYQLETGTRLPLLSWVETGVLDLWQAELAFFPDGRIAALARDLAQACNRFAELTILTPTPRTEQPERIILTIGSLEGMGGGLVGEAIAAFNRESTTHQIRLHNYGVYNTADNWHARRLRVQMDLMTGRGPDIILDVDDIMITRGLLLDLYPFLDRDDILDRGDFLPSALRALEGPDRTLVMLSNYFYIDTMIAIAHTVNHIDRWDTADFFALLQSAEQAPYLLGPWVDREQFLSIMIHFTGTEFIDWHTGQANFDSEGFIQLLNMSTLLPEPGEWQPAWSEVSVYTRMIRGEQLLEFAFLSEAERFAEYPAALGEVRVLGIPTGQGGIHVLRPGSGMGINAQTAHSDAAWDFLRRFLLPEAGVVSGFPIRQDLFEAHIERAMSPTLTEGGMEIPRQIWMGDGLTIEYYAMTAEMAAQLREIIEAAIPAGRFDPGLWDIVLEALSAFFAGDHTAEDTARILQNRVQTYLSELR
ncbi:MAG: hypothetical protein FWC72_03025 [Oscillospiraceae bacterium]|nr:hypothetical protein [Oscillospiraceae bacterium]